ncbi:hypothetical protein RUND412_006923 [Rhizina undulata]
MSIVHIVQFKFPATADPELILKISHEFIALKTNCIYPTSNQPYILALRGGKDNSIEGLQNGFTHSFVVEFDSAEHRDYYVRLDPAHKAFVALLGEVKLEGVQVLDFTPGEF